MRHLAIYTAAFTALAAPVLANGYGQGTAVQDCQAYANGVGFSGAKSGYAAEYQAAYDSCLARYSGGYAGYIPSPHRNRARITATCPPGAPKMYRGTLYCLN